MLIRMLAGNEAARANLAPKLIRAGLVALCLWWGFVLWVCFAPQRMVTLESVAGPQLLAETALWIAIALLAWGLLRGGLTQTTPRALPFVLTVFLCGQTVHATLPFFLTTTWGSEVLAIVWPFVLVLTLGLAARLAAIFIYRRWPVLVMVFVFYNVLVQLMLDNMAKGSAPVGAVEHPRPSLALDLFSIALLYAYYRSRRATPSQEAPAP